MSSSTRLHSTRNARLLIVDDNRLGLQARKVVLEELGYTVEVSSSPEEALALVAARQYDLVITDYLMPAMNGKEFIGEVRKIRPEVPVILISGFVDAMGLDEKGTGADAVVQKSNNEVNHLVRAVDRLLNRAQRKGPSSESGAAKRSRRRKA